MRLRSGGGGDRPFPFRIIVTLAGVGWLLIEWFNSPLVLVLCTVRGALSHLTTVSRKGIVFPIYAGIP